MSSRLLSPFEAARRLLVTIALLAATTVFAQAAPDTDAVLDASRTQIDALQKQLRDATAADELQRLRDTAQALQASTGKIADDLAPQLANVEARLAELGPRPPTGPEAPDVAAQRASLDKAKSQLDAQLKLARLLSVEGEQAAEAAAAQRRSRFQAQLGERTASVLARPFWSELHAGLSRDAGRAQAFFGEIAAAARATPLHVWAGFVLACAAVGAVRALAGRWLLRFTAHRVPAGRLRRSVMALAMTLLALLVPVFAAHMLRLALNWGAPLSKPLDDWLIGTVGVVTFCAYLSGLGKALLSARRPSWRLPPVPDSVARHVRRYPPTLAVVIVLGSTTERIGTVVNAGLATAVSLNGLFALTLGAVLGHMLRRARHLGREAAAEGEKPVPTWLSAMLGAGWLMLTASGIAVLVGYVALGSFLVKQVVWIGTIVATVYLLCAVIDDLLMGYLASPVADGEAEHAPHLRDQLAVLLSGVLRLVVALVALVLILAPFGQGPTELLARADQLREGVAIGEIAVRPTAVLQALLVFVIGMVFVKLLQRWLAERYLPTTRLDAGMRMSATTLLGYVGAVMALAFALSAVGLGLERIAWVASALSVGIGFGLQAVVSNFVSGLILLAERPVKVGDWVSLSGVEGDIRRINVRATEIQMGDRSTVIVPNSEFITKIVRNVTLANPQGLVQIKLPMPLDTDVTRVHDEMLAAFVANDEILDSPAPGVNLDGIEAGQLVFNATGFVNSPRKAYGVKSALLFDILKRLGDAQLPMTRINTMLLREPPAAAPT